jgi:hypothetical protein
MKKSLVALVLSVFVIFIVFVGVDPLFGAKGDPMPHKGIQYKIVQDLGKRSTISKMEKALESFEEQQKGKALLEIDLKRFGDEGWELVYFERESGYAIFKQADLEKK